MNEIELMILQAAFADELEKIAEAEKVAFIGGLMRAAGLMAKKVPKVPKRPKAIPTPGKPIPSAGTVSRGYPTTMRSSPDVMGKSWRTPQTGGSAAWGVAPAPKASAFKYASQLRRIQQAGGPAAFFKRLRDRRAIARMPRARSAQVGKGATGKIDTSPNFMTTAEQSRGRNIAGGQTVAAPAPVMRGGVLHYST